jgi:hypothetical protein
MVECAADNPQSLGRNGFHRLRRMSSMNRSMRCNTPAAIGTLLIAGYGLQVFKPIQNVLLTLAKIEKY